MRGIVQVPTKTSVSSFFEAGSASSIRKLDKQKIQRARGRHLFLKPAAVERSKPSKSAAAVIMRRPKIGKANWEAAKEKEKVTEDEAR